MNGKFIFFLLLVHGALSLSFVDSVAQLWSLSLNKASIKEQSTSTQSVLVGASFQLRFSFPLFCLSSSSDPAIVALTPSLEPKLQGSFGLRCSEALVSASSVDSPFVMLPFASLGSYDFQYNWLKLFAEEDEANNEPDPNALKLALLFRNFSSSSSIPFDLSQCQLEFVDASSSSAAGDSCVLCDASGSVFTGLCCSFSCAFKCFVFVHAFSGSVPIRMATVPMLSYDVFQIFPPSDSSSSSSPSFSASSSSSSAESVTMPSPSSPSSSSLFAQESNIQFSKLLNATVTQLAASSSPLISDSESASSVDSDATDAAASSDPMERFQSAVRLGKRLRNAQSHPSRFRSAFSAASSVLPNNPDMELDRQKPDVCLIHSQSRVIPTLPLFINMTLLFIFLLFFSFFVSSALRSQWRI